jgi:GTP cyclohydrolase II
MGWSTARSTSPSAWAIGPPPSRRLDAGLDTYEANLALGHREDERSYLVAAQMLRALGVLRVALLSNNPDKARQPTGSG